MNLYRSASRILIILFNALSHFVEIKFEGLAYYFKEVIHFPSQTVQKFDVLLIIFIEIGFVEIASTPQVINHH